MQKFILSLIFIFSFTYVFAQDIITKRDGEQIRAKVEEVNPYEIRYFLFDNNDNMVYSVPTIDVFMIQYQSGRKEIINNSLNSENKNKEVFGNSYYNKNKYTYLNYINRPIPKGLEPNMPYRKIKRLYKSSDYISQDSDLYMPELAGVCSALLPGLGQIMTGESLRGVGFFLGITAIGIGTILSSTSLFMFSPLITLSILFTAPLILAGLYIWNVVDAIHIAKIKNMYYQDLYRLRQMRINTSINPNNNELRYQNQAKLFSYSINF